MANNMRVGIIGTGNIAPAYIRGTNLYDWVDLVACADVDLNRARSFAGAHNLQALSLDDMLASPEIDIVINLTPPMVHHDTSMAIIQAGKHVYSEKPLTVERGDGAALLDAAAANGVRVGCAPDTFLGGGIQTCRKLIDDGAIGTPISASAFMMGRGPESWHPNPFFFYRHGGGPMLDMGPYYITALVTLMGGVTGVTGKAATSIPERIAGAEAVRGQTIPVETPTHYTGLLEFDGGALATMSMSFEIHAHNLPRIEIYGTEGSLSVPDPNTFGGPVQLWTPATGTWETVPLTHRDDVQRGVGLAEMALAIEGGRDHRASGALAYHVLDVMTAFVASSEQNAQVKLSSTVARPAALPPSNTGTAPEAMLAG